MRPKLLKQGVLKFADRIIPLAKPSGEQSRAAEGMIPYRLIISKDCFGIHARDFSIISQTKKPASP
jgi:hypothetical protein